MKLCRAVAPLALLVALASPALADGPAPGAPAPPAPAPLALRSPAMLGGGIAAVVAGAAGLVAGGFAWKAGQVSSLAYSYGSPGPAVSYDMGARNGGIVALVLGAASVVVGVPLIIVGARKVRAVPEVAASGLRWRF